MNRTALLLGTFHRLATTAYINYEVGIGIQYYVQQLHKGLIIYLYTNDFIFIVLLARLFIYQKHYTTVKPKCVIGG